MINAVKYEARLEDGTVVAKSDGVEFTVKEGQYFMSFCMVVSRNQFFQLLI